MEWDFAILPAGESNKQCHSADKRKRSSSRKMVVTQHSDRLRQRNLLKIKTTTQLIATEIKEVHLLW